MRASEVVGFELILGIENCINLLPDVAKNLGLRVKTFSLRQDLDWRFDTDELNQAVTHRTRLITICNTNNSTGYILTEEERKTVIQIAERGSAWILADEVYSGAEHHHGEVTSSFWGNYERVLTTGSMSKTHVIAGLSIGWVVSNAEMGHAI